MKRTKWIIGLALVLLLAVGLAVGAMAAVYDGTNQKENAINDIKNRGGHYYRTSTDGDWISVGDTDSCPDMINADTYLISVVSRDSGRSFDSASLRSG